MNLRKEQKIDTKEMQDQKWSKYTHAFGFALYFIISFPFIFYVASVQSSIYLLIGIIVFCISVLLVYASSTLYHTFYFSERRMRFRKWDHYCIYILIAGTNTPFVLRYIDGWTSVLILTVFWGLVALGIYLKAYFFERMAWISLPFYLLMGWMGLLTIFFAYPFMDYYSLLMMLVGGGVYTVGTIFYNAEYIKYNHTIWHLFVIAGTACHYLGMYFLLQ